MSKYKEIFKLKEMLEKAEIPYIFIDRFEEDRNIMQYIKRQAVFNKKYIFTISHEKSGKIYNNGTRIKAVNIKTGEEKIFNKFREASDFYGYVYVTFMQKFRKGQLSKIGDWELEEI